MYKDNRAYFLSGGSHLAENANLLKKANLKTTKKRLMMLECLRNSESPLTAEDLYTLMKKSVNINLSTVYRSLSALSDAGIVTKQMLSDGNNVYQIKTSEHKHILSCRECGKVSYVDTCPVQSIIEDVSEKTGYVITGHNLEFIGICPECSKKERHGEEE